MRLILGFEIFTMHLFFKKHTRCSSETTRFSETPRGSYCSSNGVALGGHNINNNNTNNNNTIDAGGFPYNQPTTPPLPIPTISVVRDAPPSYTEIMLENYGKYVQKYLWVNTSKVLKCT